MEKIIQNLLNSRVLQELDQHVLGGVLQKNNLKKFRSHPNNIVFTLELQEKNKENHLKVCVFRNWS